jgi:hypothetical protein
MEQLTRLWADFNEARGGNIWTNLAEADFVPEGEPHEGQWIELWDHEGNRCWGVVTEVDYPIVYLRLDLSTWVDSSTVQMERELVGAAPVSRSRSEVHTQPRQPRGTRP